MGNVQSPKHWFEYVISLSAFVCCNICVCVEHHSFGSLSSACNAPRGKNADVFCNLIIQINLESC